MYGFPLRLTMVKRSILMGALLIFQMYPLKMGLFILFQAISDNFKDWIKITFVSVAPN
jgi:hypothetical protein